MMHRKGDDEVVRFSRLTVEIASSTSVILTSLFPHWRIKQRA